MKCKASIKVIPVCVIGYQYQCNFIQLVIQFAYINILLYVYEQGQSQQFNRHGIHFNMCPMDYKLCNALIFFLKRMVMHHYGVNSIINENEFVAWKRYVNTILTIGQCFVLVGLPMSHKLRLPCASIKYHEITKDLWYRNIFAKTCLCRSGFQLAFLCF